MKVQRPGVLETVTIDLFIIRRIGQFLKRFPDIPTDFVALLDEWAARFFEELDYVREGANATKFAEQMKDDLPQVPAPCLSAPLAWASALVSRAAARAAVATRGRGPQGTPNLQTVWPLQRSIAMIAALSAASCRIAPQIRARRVGVLVGMPRRRLQRRATKRTATCMSAMHVGVCLGQLELLPVRHARDAPHACRGGCMTCRMSVPVVAASQWHRGSADDCRHRRVTYACGPRPSRASGQG